MPVLKKKPASALVLSMLLVSAIFPGRAEAEVHPSDYLCGFLGSVLGFSLGDGFGLYDAVGMSAGARRKVLRKYVAVGLVTTLASSVACAKLLRSAARALDAFDTMRRSPAYLRLVKRLGKEAAEDIVYDIYGDGSDPEKIAKKHAKNEQEVLDLKILIDAVNGSRAIASVSEQGSVDKGTSPEAGSSESHGQAPAAR